MIWRLSIIVPLSTIVNSALIALLNEIRQLHMQPLEVVGWAIITALIGNVASELIRYAIKLAKEHQV